MAGVSYQERSVCVCVCVCVERGSDRVRGMLLLLLLLLLLLRIVSLRVVLGLRQSVGLTRVEELFTDKYTYDVACKIVQDVLK